MFTLLDDPEQALQHLRKPLAALRDSLEHGASFATSTMEGHADDPYLWAHLTRYEARNDLATKTEDGWSIGRRLANSGIEIVSEPLVVRALKTQGSTTPHPGRNAARINFWTQAVTQLRLPLRFGNREMPQSANLIVDWSIGHDNDILLALAKPVGTWRYRGNPKLAWRKPVVFDASDEPSFVPASEDVEVLVEYDQDELKGEREG